MNPIPAVDLHRHMDGNVRIETMIAIAKRTGAKLPSYDPETLRPYVQVITKEPDLLGFLKKFEVIQEIFTDYEAVRQITIDNMEDADRDGLDYVELRFSPYFMSMRYGLDVDRLVATVCETVAENQDQFRCKVGLIVIMSRHFGVDRCEQELAAAIKFQDQGIIGIDLAGDEANYPGSMFVKHFDLAAQMGLRRTCHAGEASGAASVYQAVTELHVQRVGHGVRAIEDPAVVELLVERKIPLEVCPTSNVQTNTVGSYEDHPLKALLDAGVLTTLNTDDPGISNIDMHHEWRVAKENLRLTADEIDILKKNGWDACFLNPANC